MLNLQFLLDPQEETSHRQVVPSMWSSEGKFWVEGRHMGSLSIDVGMDELSQQERGK